MGVLVNKKRFAEIIGKSPRTITNFIDEGMPSMGGGRGHALQIDTESAIEWLIEHEINRRFGEDCDEDGGNTDEDRALKRVRREKIELEIKQARGQLVPLSEISDLLMNIASVFGSRLDSLASRVAGDLAVEDDPAVIRERIFAECRHIRAATADKLRQTIQDILDGFDEIFEGGQ